ncbi:MAG: FHA domain-containing protein [Chloroflexota bacterium]
MTTKDRTTKPSTTVPTPVMTAQYIVKAGSQEIGRINEKGGILARSDFAARQLIILHESISRPHALLYRDARGRTTLTDVASYYGTEVNQRPIDNDSTRLRHGDRIFFGNFVEYEVDLNKDKLISLSGKPISDLDISGSGQWLITRDQLDTILVDNPQVADPHLVIKPGASNGESLIRVRDLNRDSTTIIDGIRLNGESNPYTGNSPVQFQIGVESYSILESNTNKSNAKSIRANLKDSKSEEILFLEFTEDYPMQTIGRGKTRDVIIPDPGVSRDHAAITYSFYDQKFVIQNKSKTSSTLVNGHPLPREAPRILSNYTRIQFDTQEFTFSYHQSRREKQSPS